MIGIWSEYSHLFLLVLATTTTLLFALPIFLFPLRWAKVLMWRIPEDTDLAVYFGRCLGAFALLLEFLMFRAGLTGSGLIFTFEAMMIIWVFMVVVHVWGWVKGAQPITETIEIPLWLLLIVATLAFWPTAG